MLITVLETCTRINKILPYFLYSKTIFGNLNKHDYYLRYSEKIYFLTLRIIQN